MLNSKKAKWVLALIGLTWATAMGEAGNTLEIKHEYFWDKNRVWNQTPSFSLTKSLSRKWSFGWEQELDIVSGASRRLGADKVGLFGDRELDAVSSASKVEVRHSENPSLSYAHKGVTASVSYYTSRENDYFSQSPAGSFSWDFNERNTTVGVNYAEFFDDFAPTGAYKGLGGKKRITSMGGTLAQSVTPLTLIGFTGTWIRSHGFLGHPYNPPIDVNGAMLLEKVPDTKQAGALAAQLVQGYHMGELLGSMNLDFRRYQDDWGMKSSTLDSKLSQYITESTYIRFRVRYYQQTGSVFAKPTYTGAEQYITADVRYYPFTSWLGGFKLSSAFPESWGESLFLPDRWDVKYDHTFRNTHGDPVNTALGIPRHLTYQLYSPDEMYQQGVFMFGLLFNL